MRPGRAFLLLAVLLLGGCVDTPPTIPQVKPVAEDRLGLSAEPAPPTQAQWWKAFQDPQADRLAGKLMAGNPTLAGALARIRAAQAALAAARADTYPQVTLDGTLEQELVSNAYVITKPYAGNWNWVGDVEAHLTWSLDFWGKQKALIEKARGLSEALALDEAAARLALAGAFAQAYVGLALAWQELDIAHQTLDERQSILNLTQSRADAGLENDAAVEQAKSLLAMARLDVRRAEAQRDMGVHAIAALIGEGANAWGDIARPSAALDTTLPLPKSLPADLLSRRPDILAAQARVRAAMQGRAAAEADFYPDIDLTAALGFQAVGLPALFTGNAFTTGVGPAIHLPIFDAGKLRARYAGATADLDVAVADYNQAVVGAIRQAADAMTQVKSLADQRGDQQAALDSGTRAFVLAKERYRLGLSGQIPLLTAENTLLTARHQMASLMAQAAVGRVTLLLATGGDFTPPPTQAIAHE